MAIFSQGPIVGAISGSVGGATFVNGRGSRVLRHRPARPAPKGTGIQATQSAMNQLQNAWADLTDAQRLQWRTAAVNVNRTNRLGLSAPLSGLQFFLSVNIPMRQSPAAFFPEPNVVGTSEGPTSFTVSLSAAGSLTWNAQPPFGFGAGFWLCWARLIFTPTPPTAVRGLVFMKAVSGASMTENIRTEIEARFGAPIQGQTMLCGCSAQAGNLYMSKALTLIETVGA